MEMVYILLIFVILSSHLFYLFFRWLLRKEKVEEQKYQRYIAFGLSLVTSLLIVGIVGSSIYILLSICIPSYLFYFFFRWLLRKKKVGQEKYQIPIAFGLSLATSLLLVGIGIGYISWKLSHPPLPKMEFSEEVWKESPVHRFQMMWSIKEQDLLIGKTSDEFIALLGERYQTFVENENLYKIVYPERGFMKGQMFYLIIYLENDEVINVEAKPYHTLTREEFEEMYDPFPFAHRIGVESETIEREE